jgi:hypothetical protein
MSVRARNVAYAVMAQRQAYQGYPHSSTFKLEELFFGVLTAPTACAAASRQFRLVSYKRVRPAPLHVPVRNDRPVRCTMRRPSTSLLGCHYLLHASGV